MSRCWSIHLSSLVLHWYSGCPKPVVVVKDHGTFAKRCVVAMREVKEDKIPKVACAYPNSHLRLEAPGETKNRAKPCRCEQQRKPTTCYWEPMFLHPSLQPAINGQPFEEFCYHLRRVYCSLIR